MSKSSSATTYEEFNPLAFGLGQKLRESKIIDSPVEKLNDVFDYLMKNSRISVSSSDISIEKSRPTISTSSHEKHSKNGETFKTFQVMFSSGVQYALPWVVKTVESGRLSKQDVIRWTFPLLIKARGIDFEDLYQFLVDIGDAESIMEYALYKSREGVSHRYLQLASAMMGELKETSVETLKKLFRSNHPESSSFVSTACFLEGIPFNVKQELLELVKNSTSKDARLTLVNSLEYADLPFRDEFLNYFTSDSDEEVREQAIEILDR